MKHHLALKTKRNVIPPFVATSLRPNRSVQAVSFNPPSSHHENPDLFHTQAKILKLTNKNLCDMETFHGSDGLPTDNHEEDDNVSVARTALSEGGRSVRSIHSTRSLAAIAEKARVGIVTSRASENGVGTAPARIGDRRASTREGVGWTDEAVNDIVVVTHQDDGGLRLGGKNTVSTLPYIRRNPAV